MAFHRPPFCGLKKMKRVRALQSFAGHKRGEEFDLSDEEARILAAPDLVGGQKVEVVDRAMNAEQPGQRRGRYARRDMRADE
jgi:hypothetical protein